MNSEEQIPTARFLQKRAKNTENAKKYFSIRVPQHISRILADIDSSHQPTLENSLLAYCSFFTNDVVLFNLYGKFGYDKSSRKFTRPVPKIEFIEELAKEYGIEFILKNEKEDELKENTAPGEDMFEGLKEELSRTFFEKGLDVFSDPLDLGFNNNSNAYSSRNQERQNSIQNNMLFHRDVDASLLSNEELLNNYEEKNEKDLGVSRGSWIYSPNISLNKLSETGLSNNDKKIGSGGTTDLSFASKFLSNSKKQSNDQEKGYNLIDEISKIREKILGKDKASGALESNQSASFRKISMDSGGLKRGEYDFGATNGYRGHSDVDKTPQKPISHPEGSYNTPLSRAKKFDEFSDTNTPRSSRGLRRLSKTVKDMVNTKKRASYKEIADEVIRESTGCEHKYLLDTPMSSVQQTPSTPNSHTGKSEYSNKKTEKNIRRRVYDALNVLVAADVIGKDGKMVIQKDKTEGERATGSMGNLKIFQEKNAKLHSLDSNIKEAASNIKEKKKYLTGLVQKFIALKNLMTRNSVLRMKNAIKEEELIYFPCIVVSTPDNPDNAITLKTNATRTQMNICFKRDIKMHGDADILLKLGLQDVPKERAERWLENKDMIKYMPSNYI